MRKLVFVIVSALVLFASCNKDEKISAVGDVYIVSQLVGQDTLFGLSIHAYSLYDFSSVSVVPDDEPETTYTLEAYPNFKTDFYYDTPEDELSLDVPVTGNYHFTANFETGDVLEVDEVLYDDVLYPPVIVDCHYDTEAGKAVLEWEEVDNADAYVIKIYDGDDLVFLSDLIDPSYTEVEFNEYSSAWGTDYTPTTGTDLKLTLSAFQYEPNGDRYNVQASTSSDIQFVWGE